MGLIDEAAEVEALASTVDDNGDVYLVPAFSGLFAPRWRSDARGVIVGLTRFADRGHIARAALESTAFQVAEVLDAMRADSGVAFSELILYTADRSDAPYHADLQRRRTT